MDVDQVFESSPDGNPQSKRKFPFTKVESLRNPYLEKIQDSPKPQFPEIQNFLRLILSITNKLFFG